MFVFKWFVCRNLKNILHNFDEIVKLTCLTRKSLYPFLNFESIKVKDLYYNLYYNCIFFFYFRCYDI